MMKDEIEIGEYVKFKDGSIDSIKDIVNTHSDRKLIAFEKRNSYLSDLGLKKQIVKHSKNIIDIIEVGDYVNGHLVKAVYLDGVKKYIKLDNSYSVENNFKGIRTYTKDIKDIKSIVTKEKFEIVRYDVKEEDYANRK